MNAPNGEGHPPRDALPERAARAIRVILTERGTTQRQVAEKLGVTETTVSRWLARTHPMPLGQLDALADFLGVPLYLILGGPRPPPPPGEDVVAALRTQLEALTVAVREQMHLLPVFRDGDAGHPLGDEGSTDTPAAVPAGYTAVPPGRELIPGPRGFGLRLDHDRLAGRGVWHGDLCIVNPDGRWTLGSLVVAWLEGRIRLCEVALAPSGQHQWRTAPLAGPPEVWPGTAGLTVGPVVAVSKIVRLKHGLGNADARPGEASPEGAPGVRYDTDDDGPLRPEPINTER